jgi:ribonuclease VapC
MAEPLPAYVLDSYALLAYFQAEAAGPAVLVLLEAARDQNARLYLSLINAGEIYYLMHRHKGKEKAEALLKDLQDLPIIFCPATDDRIWAAARLKASHSISFADAFAATLAQEFNATLITGDPEFESVVATVKIMWLPRK